MEEVGAEKLALDRDMDIPAGTQYFMPVDRIHRVISDPSKPTATLLLQGVGIKPSARVFTDRPLEVAAPIPVPSFTDARLADKLTKFVRVLETGSML
jgi:hypothetical protein